MHAPAGVTGVVYAVMHGSGISGGLRHPLATRHYRAQEKACRQDGFDQGNGRGAKYVQEN